MIRWKLDKKPLERSIRLGKGKNQIFKAIPRYLDEAVSGISDGSFWPFDQKSNNNICRLRLEQLLS